MQGITGKVFVITGGAQGIGLGAGEAIARAGGIVAIADINGDAARAAAAQLREAGAQAAGYQWDVREHAKAEATIRRIETELGPVRGLVASAGVVNAGRSETLDPLRWGDGLAINLSGVFFACQAAGARMLEHGGGSIVTLSSVTGLQGQPARALYSSTKWGVIGMTKTLAVEWGHRGIRVNAISPNAVDSPLMRASSAGDFLQSVILDRTPLARAARIDEVASAILFLLSDAASYINGVVLPVDGGLTSGYMTHKHGDETGSVDVRKAEAKVS